MSTLVQNWLLTAPIGPRSDGVRALTTLERAQGWLAPDQGKTDMPDPQRAILKRTIRGISALVLSYINRDTIVRTERTEVYPGSRTGRIVLRNWPVLSVTSVGAPPAPALSQSLWSLEPPRSGAQRIIANASGGGSLMAGPDGISVSYVSGFVRSDYQTVPSAAPFVLQADSMLLVSEGVIDETGTTISPDLYTVDESGLYTFDSSLGGRALVLIYSYVPEDIEQVVIDETALAYRSRQRLGEQSKALPNGGGTVSYTPRALSQISKEMLNDYRRVTQS